MSFPAPSPSPSGVNNGAVNAMPMAGRFDWWQMLAPGEGQGEVASPLMITQINHGVVFALPADPPFVIPADEHFAIAPEHA